MIVKLLIRTTVLKPAGKAKSHYVTNGRETASGLMALPLRETR